MDERKPKRPPTKEELLNLAYVAKTYNLDPQLKHLILVHGQPHITIGGLLFIAARDPRFAGCEVEVIEADWERGFFLCKASVWLTGCDHPFQDYSDSDGSAMRGGDRFRHTITRAKARALRTAFAFPFCSAEEIRDEPAEATPKKGQRRSDQAEESPDAECPAPAIGKVEPILPAAPGAYPSEEWGTAKRRLYAMAKEANLANGKMKELMLAWYEKTSSTEMTADQIHAFADRIENEYIQIPSDPDEAGK